MGHDIKALRGRTFQELLEIRMRNILDSDNKRDPLDISVYIPIKAKEKNYITELEENDANLFT